MTKSKTEQVVELIAAIAVFAAIVIWVILDEHGHPALGGAIFFLISQPALWIMAILDL